LTDATVVPRSSATSDAFHCSTSRRISTARCRAGRCCSAATNARRTDSFATASSAGSDAGGSTRASGIGSSQEISGFCAGAGPSAEAAGPKSIGVARRWRLSSIVRQTFVAILYSHERTEERPSNFSYERHARTIVSCTASSASADEPSMR
jgi:hypothetical protein